MNEQDAIDEARRQVDHRLQGAHWLIAHHVRGMLEVYRQARPTILAYCGRYGFMRTLRVELDRLVELDAAAQRAEMEQAALSKVEDPRDVQAAIEEYCER